ncbi:MAG TPA: hypothetical protein DDY32_19155 [Desulfobulbaceae bacterium]|nr:hypothetical protein [Desulfobulbaceae bacterium]
MMSLNKLSAIGLGMMLLTAGTAQADTTVPSPAALDKPVQFTLAVGAERMEGDTTYQIGDPTVYANGVTENQYFPFSELEWPLDIWLARIDGTMVIKKMIRVNATVKKNLSDPNDNMKDSDWLTPSNPSQLDIYSESEISEFDAFIFDADVDWIFFNSDVVSLYAGLGFLYQDFEYEAKVLYQTYPSILPGVEFLGDGRVAITYDITYTIPYIKVGTDLKFSPKFSMAGSFSYSPFVEAEDTDNHLLRENGGKIADGDMDGDAYMFDISGKYNITPVVYVKAGFQYVKIEVDGTQTQVYGNGLPLGTVAQESESSQASGFVLVGFDF